MKNRLFVLSTIALCFCFANNNLKAQEALSPFDVDTVSVTESSDETAVTTSSDSAIPEAEENENGEIVYNPALTGTVQVNTSLNIRTDVWGTIVGCFYNGDKVTITGKKGDWYIIDLNGQKRFIHSKYVSVPNVPTTVSSGSNGGNASNGGNTGNGGNGGNDGGVSNQTTPTTGGDNSRSNNTDGSYSTMYILGDSRCVGMKFSDTNKNHVYVAKSSEGYKWFSQNYQEVLRKATAKDVIVINFGVNDLWNSSKYIPLINSIADSTQAAVYYMTVNPVDEDKEKKHGYAVKNTSINDFNQKMLKGLNSNVNIIDSNNLLNQHGFSTSDGVHYTGATYKEILNIIETNL